MNTIDRHIPELRGLVAETLAVDESLVDADSGPMTLPQWDSFNHANLMVALENKYGIELDIEEIARMITVMQIAEILEGKGVFNK